MLLFDTDFYGNEFQLKRSQPWCRRWRKAWLGRIRSTTTPTSTITPIQQPRRFPLIKVSWRVGSWRHSTNKLRDKLVLWFNDVFHPFFTRTCLISYQLISVSTNQSEPCWGVKRRTYHVNEDVREGRKKRGKRPVVDWYFCIKRSVWLFSLFRFCQKWRQLPEDHRRCCPGEAGSQDHTLQGNEAAQGRQVLRIILCEVRMLPRGGRFSGSYLTR